MSAHRHPPLNVWDYERVFEETLDAGGEAGVRDVLEIFRREIALGMQLLRCAGCCAVIRRHVQHGPELGIRQL